MRRSLIRVQVPKSNKMDVQNVIEQLRSSSEAPWNAVQNIHTTTTSTEESILFEVDSQMVSRASSHPHLSDTDTPISWVQTMYSWPDGSSIDCLGTWAVPDSLRSNAAI